MSVYIDKLRPRTLRSGLSALGSGGRSFEEGSMPYVLNNKEKRKKENSVINCY